MANYCMICGKEYEDFYDAKSHVYTNHYETFPEASVGYRDE